jgi:NAD(P)-dependent dehydrogenase (short-subunit alcohol dehydrogenase family)
VVLITGCSSGIGRATALRLAARQWQVIATARRIESLGELERAGCSVLPLDVTSESSMQKAVAAAEAAHGSIGVLINNAGYSQSGAIETVPLAQVRAQFETNVFGAARLIQLVLPIMRRAGRGRIINLSSMGGTLVFPGGGYYHATKYAIEAISDALRFEVEPFGIDVVVIQPGLIRSSFADTVVAGMKSQLDVSDPYGAFNATVARATKEAYESGPLSHLAGSPEDVARVIEGALTAVRPHTRYKVSASARVLMSLRRLLSDRMWDRVVRGSYSIPSP